MNVILLDPEVEDSLLVLVLEQAEDRERPPDNHLCRLFRYVLEGNRHTRPWLFV